MRTTEETALVFAIAARRKLLTDILMRLWSGEITREAYDQQTAAVQRQIDELDALIEAPEHDSA